MATISESNLRKDSRCDRVSGQPPSGARGTLTSPKNAAKTSKPVESGAHVVQSTELGARWHEIRDLIADCPDLLPEARQSLIAQGDEVVASS